MKKSKILIIGATGAVGTCLVKALFFQHDITAVARNIPAEDDCVLGASYVPLDVYNPDRSTFKTLSKIHFDAVLYLVHDQVNNDIEKEQEALGKMFKFLNFDKFIYFSSQDVFTNNPEKEAYKLCKRSCELVMPNRNGVAVVRLAKVLSPYGKGSVNKLLDVLNHKPFEGKLAMPSVVSCVSFWDVCCVVSRMLDVENLQGCYDVGGISERTEKLLMRYGVAEHVRDAISIYEENIVLDKSRVDAFYLGGMTYATFGEAKKLCETAAANISY